MNDLIRPALYRSHHEIHPCARPPAPRSSPTWWGRFARREIFWRAAARWPMPSPATTWRYVTAGAYGFVLSSNYNSRPRPPEILVEGERFRMIRTRETYADLVRGEVL